MPVPVVVICRWIQPPTVNTDSSLRNLKSFEVIAGSPINCFSSLLRQQAIRTQSHASTNFIIRRNKLSDPVQDLCGDMCVHPQLNVNTTRSKYVVSRKTCQQILTIDLLLLFKHYTLIARRDSPQQTPITLEQAPHYYKNICFPY